MHAAGYKLILIMPANMSEERRAAMAAFGAKLITVSAGKMELARDLAHVMQVRRPLPFHLWLKSVPTGTMTHCSCAGTVAHLCA